MRRGPPLVLLLLLFVRGTCRCCAVVEGVGEALDCSCGCCCGCAPPVAVLGGCEARRSRPRSLVCVVVVVSGVAATPLPPPPLTLPPSAFTTSTPRLPSAWLPHVLPTVLALVDAPPAGLTLTGVVLVAAVAATAGGAGLPAAGVRRRCAGSEEDGVAVPLVSPATAAACACWRSSTACGVAAEWP